MIIFSRLNINNKYNLKKYIYNKIKFCWESRDSYLSY